jgi:uncharacterized protein (UPF0276 family)
VKTISAGGGAPQFYLEKIRADYPVSLHNVGMSLGSVDALDWQHLKQLKTLIERIEPGLISEHLSWSSFGSAFLNDLAPLPYTKEALFHLVERISRVQDYLGRQLLIENPSSYLEYQQSAFSENEFLAEVSGRSGCGILQDVNNVFVSCRNHGWNTFEYLRGIPAERVEEIHLAGHTINRVSDCDILIDTHNRPVCAQVWQLYQTTLRLMGPRPTLIEWDTDLPSLQTLVAETGKAESFLEVSYERAA